jgi:hypothetical protein
MKGLEIKIAGVKRVGEGEFVAQSLEMRYVGYYQARSHIKIKVTDDVIVFEGVRNPEGKVDPNNLIISRKSCGKLVKRGLKSIDPLV